MSTLGHILWYLAFTLLITYTAVMFYINRDSNRNRGGREMNPHPHIHMPRVTRTYPYAWKGNWYVAYGDTQVRFAWNWQRPDTWSEEKYERATRKAAIKAIRIHDEGTQREARKEAQRQARRDRTSGPIRLPIFDSRRWGSEQLDDEAS